jgi:hypothetical protein
MENNLADRVHPFPEPSPMPQLAALPWRVIRVHFPDTLNNPQRKLHNLDFPIGKSFAYLLVRPMNDPEQNCWNLLSRHNCR